MDECLEAVAFKHDHREAQFLTSMLRTSSRLVEIRGSHDAVIKQDPEIE